MKKLRAMLMILAVPAALLFGAKEIGGSPIYKGDDVGLAWKALPNSAKLVLTNDMGDITCLLRLKMAGAPSSYRAELANGTVLKVSGTADRGEEGWIEISAVSSNPQEKFKWPSGTGVFVFPVPQKNADMGVRDWEIFLTDKHPDSQTRAKWRDRGFNASLAFLVLALIGGALEAAERLKEKPQPVPAERPLTAQTLIEAMIQNVFDEKAPADKAAERTQWMRSVLTKVVLQNVPPLDAIADSPLPEVERKIVYLGAIGKLKRQADSFQQELLRLSARLEQPLFHAEIFPITGPSEPIGKGPAQ
jgi:hypothetical protein